MKRLSITSYKVKSMVKVACGGVVAFGAIGIWTGDAKFFENFLQPLLNRVDPEMSHRAAIFVAKYHLTRAAPEDNPPNLKTKVGQLLLSNPVGLAAGFDKSGECVSGLARLGLGWVEIGSVTPLPQEGNPKPRLFRLPEDLAVINRYGFNNDGHELVHERIQDFKKAHPDYPVGINLGANKESPDRIRDYCLGVEAFSDTADYFVINVSSPNTPNLRDLQKSESLNELLKKVFETRNKQSRKVPIFLKVAPDLTDADIKSICKSVTKKGFKVDGLIVSNTTVSRSSLKSTESLRSEIGGLSGKPLGDVSTKLIGKFYKELKGEIPIIGVGGIWDGKDAFEKICAGASAVQLYTALTYRGPGIIHNVKTELSNLLSQNGFESVEQAVGSSQTKTASASGQPSRILSPTVLNVGGLFLSCAILCFAVIKKSQ